MSSYKDATSTTWSISQGCEVIGSANLKYLNGSNDADTIGNININMPTKIGNNYIPKNNKLFTSKVFTDEILHNLDDKIIRPSFELPSQEAFTDIDEFLENETTI